MASDSPSCQRSPEPVLLPTLSIINYIALHVCARPPTHDNLTLPTYSLFDKALGVFRKETSSNDKGLTNVVVAHLNSEEWMPFSFLFVKCKSGQRTQWRKVTSSPFRSLSRPQLQMKRWADQPVTKTFDGHALLYGSSSFLTQVCSHFSKQFKRCRASLLGRAPGNFQGPL